MPKRVIDFDAMWGSDKLAACAEWAQAEYAWLYGLADASGCFELTNLRVIWGRVAAIRRNLSIERLEQIFGEFQDKGLLFAWEHEGKRYGHWTGSDVPGRLPPPSWRMRLERLAPPVPKQALSEYVSRYARGRAGLQGGGFLTEGRAEEGNRRAGSFDLDGAGGHGERNFKSEISDLKCSRGAGIRRLDSGGVVECRAGQAGDGLNQNREAENLLRDRLSGLKDRSIEGKAGLKARVEAGQEQNWNGDLNWEGKRERKPAAAVGSGTELEAEGRDAQGEQTLFSPSVAPSVIRSNPNSFSNLNSKYNSLSDPSPVFDSNCDLRSNSHPSFDSDSSAETRTNSGMPSGNAPAVAGFNGERVGAKYPAEERMDTNRLAAERSDANCAGASAGDGTPGAYRGERAVAARASYGFRGRDKAEILAGELLVGQGPVCGPVRVKPEALERNRRRNAARDGSRSP